MPEDDSVWFAVDCHGKSKKSFQRLADIWCAVCGMKYDNRSLGCVVTIQQECSGKMVRAFPLPPGCCSNLMSALKIANNLHGCEAKTEENLSYEWCPFRDNDELSVLSWSRKGQL